MDISYLTKFNQHYVFEHTTLLEKLIYVDLWTFNVPKPYKKHEYYQPQNAT